MVAEYTLYGYRDKLKPRRTLSNEKPVRVEAGTEGSLVRSGVDDWGVHYRLVDFNGVFVYLPRSVSR